MTLRAGRVSRALAALLLASVSAGAMTAACGGGGAAPGPAAAGAAPSDPRAARREALIARVLTSPDDVAAWLELSAEEDRAGRPSAALDALEQAALHRAPLGRDLGEADRQRQARLLAARGRVRLGRGAASALADLERAKEGGAAVTAEELLAAEVAAALAEARHSDKARRSQGLRRLAALAGRGGEAAIARGEAEKADVAARVRWASWLWRRGAKRAAYDRLSALQQQHLAPEKAARFDDETVALWAEVWAWWSPSWRGASSGPPKEWRRGERRCALVALPQAQELQCSPQDVLTGGARSSLAERDVLRLPIDRLQPLRPGSDHRNALVLMIVRGFLEGLLDDAPRQLQRHLDVPYAATSSDAARPSLAVRALLLRLAGDPDAAEALRRADAAPPATTAERLLLAYEHLVRGEAAPAQELLSAIEAGEAGAPAVLRLRAVASALSGPLAGPLSGPLAAPGPALAEVADAAAVRAALTAADPASAGAPRLLEIAASYRRDVAVARRKAADFVAQSDDAAAAHAQLGALYLLLDDPASARAAWRAAVDRSAEPAFLQGLAVACAAAKDPDAALLFMTSAAAASGDPTPVLLDVAEELLRAGSATHALEAAKSALALAPLPLYGDALDVALRAARALDRRADVAALRTLGAATEAAPSLGDASSASSVERALDANSPDLPDLLWLATRWQPRAVSLRAQLLARLPLGDPRRAVLVDELAALAGDPDRPRRAAAVAALRALPAR